AEVVYQVEEGMRSFFGKTIVRGNTRTDTDRITRLVTWDEGDAFSEQEVLTTQRNLTRTGVFRRVELSPMPADPSTQVRPVEVEVREGRPLSLLYGIGYQYAPDALENRSDPLGIAGVSYNNLFGAMRSASIEVQYAPLSERGRAVATFREPFLFNRDIPLNVVAFFTREPIQEVDIERAGTVLESSRLFWRYLRVGLRYEYSRIEPVNPQKLSTIEQEFSKFDQPIKQSAIGPNFFYDRRDDIIDPREGYYVTAATKYAFPFLQAEANYLKLSGQASGFRRFGRGVFAVSARAGTIFNYGEEEEVPVPIAERFFAGGRSTNRGFDTDLVGIPGVTVDHDTKASLREEVEGAGSCADTYPDPELARYDCDTGPRIVGGNGFLGFNAEYRFPIIGNLGGTVFYDLAQVWKNPSDIRLAIEGETGLRQGVGVGLWYMTPIGPLRLEYGWPIDARSIPYNVTTVDENGDTVILVERDPRDVRKEKGRLFFSIGYPF
ncbi:MAG: BamA/OMP85 family outer membrane protein, partial [Thermoplasmata archaeon]